MVYEETTMHELLHHPEQISVSIDAALKSGLATSGFNVGT